MKNQTVEKKLLDKREILIKVGLIHPAEKRTTYRVSSASWKHPSADDIFEAARMTVGDDYQAVLDFCSDMAAALFYMCNMECKNL